MKPEDIARIEKNARIFAKIVGGLDSGFDSSKYRSYLSGAIAEHEFLQKELNECDNTIKSLEESLCNRLDELKIKSSITHPERKKK